jgi:hypothetical protein
VSPIASEAEIMVVDSIKPMTIRMVCARRLGMFLRASFKRMRLRIAILISTRLVIPRIVASEMDSHNIGTPNRVSKFS